MRDQTDLLLLIPTMFFLVGYSFLFSYGYAERQSQSTSTICNGDGNSCYTTFCTDDQPCQTLSSDQPDEEVAVMQPDEEVAVMQPDEEVAVMQPVDVTEKYVDATLEDCDDGLDNDIDGKADAVDEECNSGTSYRSPLQGQKTSQLDNYGFGRSDQEDGQDERSDENDSEDSKDNYNEQEESNDQD